MIARVLYLLVAGMAFLLVAGVSARAWGGDEAFLQVGAATLLCLVPALGTLIWLEQTLARDPHQASLMALGASGVRIFGVLALAVLLYLWVPFLHEFSFLVWVLAAYLYTLTIEVVLLVAALQPKQPQGEVRDGS